MSDNTPEMNSAEQEAEAILKAALVKADLDGSDCPQGDACAIHFRNDEEVVDEGIEYGRIITYAGDYVVITTDNPELANPITMLKLMLSGKEEDIPPLYETCVIRVGGGTLSDMRALGAEDRRDSIRFVQQHDDWKNFKEAHATIVSGLREGLIDVSKPAFPAGQ